MIRPAVLLPALLLCLLAPTEAQQAAAPAGASAPEPAATPSAAPAAATHAAAPAAERAAAPPATPANPTPAAAPVVEQADLHGEPLWGGLFWGGSTPYAGDPDASEAPAAALEALRDNPNTRFPHQVLIGHDATHLPSVWYTWIRFSEEFFLRIERGGSNAEGDLLVDVQFWQQDQLLLSSAVVLTADRPLVIRGPAWRGGYLLAILLLEQP